MGEEWEKMKASEYNLIVPTKKEDELIIYNTLQNRAAIVDRELKNLIVKKPDEIPERYCSELKDAGFLIDDEMDERRMYKVLFEKSKYDRSTTVFTVLPTYSCNFGCVYCYEGRGETISQTMDEKMVERTIKFGKSLIENTKAFQLMFYGGEPFLYPDIALKILKGLKEEADKNNVKFSAGATTNSSLLTKGLLNELVNNGMNYLEVSLAGSKEFHDKKRPYKDGKGSYDRIMDSLVMIKDVNAIRLMLRVNVDKENLPHMEELFVDLKKRGINNCSLNFEKISGGRGCLESCSSLLIESFKEWEEAHKELLELAAKYSFNAVAIDATMMQKPPVFCPHLRERAYVIDPYGDVYHCDNSVGVKERKIGELNEEGELIHLTCHYYDWMSRDPLLMEECGKCRVLPLCGGGCAAAALNSFGTLHKGFCYDFKKMISQKIKIALSQMYPDKFKEGIYIGEWIE